ncbi:MAG: hypothetical protein E6G65_07230 [Actinobacteria bacterium]|nr:MAG: hypothetical protein E6G65_07230 [Actinomycetota bacterium]
MAEFRYSADRLVVVRELEDKCLVILSRFYRFCFQKSLDRLDGMAKEASLEFRIRRSLTLDTEGCAHHRFEGPGNQHGNTPVVLAIHSDIELCLSGAR